MTRMKEIEVLNKYFMPLLLQRIGLHYGHHIELGDTDSAHNDIIPDSF